MAKKHAAAASQIASPKHSPTQLLAWATIGLALFFGVVFVVYWRAGYNSDTIMTGLMAKNVIVRGERPIFLWHMGYHGVIPNVYVTALFFQLFGVSPSVNLLFTLIAWWGLMYAVYTHVTSIWGKATGLVAVLVLLASSVELYTKIMRSEPGYTEAFFCGLMLLILSRRAIVALYAQQRALDRRVLLTIAGAGFFAGFGFYIYQLTAYFIALVGALIASMALRETFKDFRYRKPLDWLVLATGASGILVIIDSVQAFVRKTLPLIPIETSALRQVVIGINVFALALVLDVARRHWKSLVTLWRALPAFAAGLLLGISPKLYFTYVQNGTTINRTGFDDSLQMFIQRLTWAWENNKVYLNVHESDIVSQILVVAWVGVLLGFAVYVLRMWFQFAAGRTERDAIERLDPLSLLPWVVVPIFGLSSAVYDWQGSRYTIVLYLYYALAAAWAVTWTTKNTRAWVRYAGIAAALFVFIFNCRHIQTDLERWEGEGFEAEDLVAALQSRGVHYGYSDYWAAYAITFYTDEDVILQPTYSAYAPAYGPIVEKADRVAIIKKRQNMHQMQKVMPINGALMRVTDAWQGKVFGFYVLEKTDPDALTRAN